MTKLLIVDDNPQSLYMLQTLLSAKGFELELASNGAEAFEKARRNPPNMVISDILMPVMDGFSLCRAWKADERLKNIPFVFYTATYTDPQDEDFALSLGAERFIVKPMEPAKFLAILQEVIESHRAGKLIAPREPIANSIEYYEKYSATLVRKLEDKLTQLEEANHALERELVARKEAEEEARRRASELEAVHKVSTELRNAQSAEKALPVLLDETLAALQADAGSILLYEPSRGELRSAAARGWFHELVESPIPPGEGIAGTVFSSGKVHVSAEFADDPLARASVRGRIPPGWGGVCVPIRVSKIVIGVLFVSMRVPRQITGAEVKVLEALAEMAGTALHRLRLHDEALRRVQQLQALYNIDRAITSAFDLRLTLNVLLEQILLPLAADASGVLLFNPHALALEYFAGRGFRGRGYEHSKLRLGEEQSGKAALERRTICIANISQCEPPFIRLALLADEGLVSYAVTPLITKGQLLGVLEIFHRQPFEHGSDWLNFFDTIANQASIAIENARLIEGFQRSNLELSLAYDATIEGWSRVLDLRDKETEGHTQRVTELTIRLARAAGMNAEELTHVRRGALLHDIGKMGVPDTILLKPDKLTDEEWAIMRQHPTLAYDMLSPIEYLRPALNIPYCHHEKWDGSGYPRGLKGEEIPLAARLFAVVDVWDALRSARPYRKAWTEGEALEYIRTQSGKHFDPQVVELFFRVLEADMEGAG